MANSNTSRSNRLSSTSDSLEVAGEIAFIAATTKPSNSQDSSHTNVETEEDEFSFSYSSVPLKAQPSGPANNASSQEDSGLSHSDTYTSSKDGPSVVTTVNIQAHSESLELEKASSDQGTKARRTALFGHHDVDQVVLVLYGPSGCGRGLLTQKLVGSEPETYSLVVSHTTRRKRPYEVDGRDLHFVTSAELTLEKERGGLASCTRVMERASTFNASSYHSTSVQIPVSSSPVLPSASGPTAKAKASTIPKLRKRAASLFDLADEDDSSGEMFAISWQALQEARAKGTPYVVINVNADGAKQLRDSGVEGKYVAVHPSADDVDVDDDGDKPEAIPKAIPEAPHDDSVDVECASDHKISVSSPEQALSELKLYSSTMLRARPTATTTQQPADAKLKAIARAQAQGDWDLVPTVSLQLHERELENKKRRRSRRVRSELTQNHRMVSFTELLLHFQSKSVMQQLVTVPLSTSSSSAGISAPSTTSGKSKGSTGIFKTKLSKKLQMERNTVYSIAECQLDNHEPLHLHTLQTIYKRLSGNRVNCPRIGRHWVDIGFQSTDPTDDLRGVGFLGLMQLVYLLEDSRTFPLAREIYLYSKDEAHYTPFCVLSLNMTQIALRALQEDLLNSECKKRDQVFQVLNDFYLSSFHRCYRAWRHGKRDASEVGVVIQDVRQHVTKNVKSVLKEAHQYLAKQEQQSSQSQAQRPLSNGSFHTISEISWNAKTL